MGKETTEKFRVRTLMPLEKIQKVVVEWGSSLRSQREKGKRSRAGDSQKREGKKSDTIKKRRI